MKKTKIMAIILGINLMFSSTITTVSAASDSSESIDVRKIGDIDMNGIVDITDLSELSLALIGDVTLTEAQQKNADVDSDGTVTLADLARLKQFISKVIDSFELKLVDIVNISLRDNIATADAEEIFYKDEKYTYVFPSIESDYIECTFSDGSKMKIKEAIEKKLVKVTDLRTYNIMYWMIDADGNAIFSLDLSAT